MQDPTHYNVKKFFRHLVKASANLKERDDARIDLAKHIELLNRLSIDKRTSKDRVEKELAFLIQKINVVVEKEKKFAALHQIDTDIIAELRTKIRILEAALRGEDRKSKRQLKNISDSLSVIKLRLKHSEKLKKPIERLEKKIEKKKAKITKKKTTKKKQNSKVKTASPKKEKTKTTNKETTRKKTSKTKNKSKNTKTKKKPQDTVSKEKLKLMKKELSLLKKKLSIMQKAKKKGKELTAVKKKIKDIERELS